MNNQELELKVKELLAIENFFDMIIAVKEFEKEYKNSNFFKATKMPLMHVIKNAKMWYFTRLEEIAKHAQDLINELDLTKIQDLLGQLGNVLQTENEETLELINSFKDLGIVK